MNKSPDTILRILLIIIIAFYTSSLFSQDITGQWDGILKVQGMELKIVFHISKSDTGYTSTMDSPDQGAKGIPVTSTTYLNSTLSIKIPNARMTYEGKAVDKNNIHGTFNQGGQSVPLNMTRNLTEKKISLLPQEPVKPYPYHTEDVTFENKKAGIKLAGTLSLPSKDGQWPVVVLISGSGPQNRDEELMGHKPFLVLSDYLTRNGIGVLRYDDRGTAASGGNFSTSTTHDFSTDAAAAVQYLHSRKEVNKKQIGLIGHSEGGIIAPMVAADSNGVGFIVLLAGPGLRGDQVMLKQLEDVLTASGTDDEEIKRSRVLSKITFEFVTRSTDTEQLKSDLKGFLDQAFAADTTIKIPDGMTRESFIQFQINQVTNPWMLYFLKHDPAPVLENVKCPVLALNGEKDLQVEPKENLYAIKDALTRGGNTNVTVKELAGLNHLFQESVTGSPDEYGTIEQTFAPPAMAEILKWIKNQVK